MYIPLHIWGDPALRASYTVDLFPLHDPYQQMPTQTVVVYATSFEEAVMIAEREAQPLRLEPKRPGSKRAN